MFHIVEAGPERVPDLEPLTRSLHRFHVTVDPQIPGIPPRDEDGWWQIRSDRYREWLAEPGSFLLIAEDEGGRAIGYALVAIRGADDSHLTGPRFAELESLAVLEEERGKGIGTALMREVYGRVRERGIEEMVIGVLATNDRVKAFYEREGFKPWVILTLGKVPEP
jgi:ribosomal protein S18 acetylase RimI-like enzyme